MRPMDEREMTVCDNGEGRCVVTVPYRGHLPMAARAAISAELRTITTGGAGQPLDSVLAVATDHHITVFVEATPAALQHWLGSGRLVSAVQQAAQVAAPPDSAQVRR